jgi:hypothetical protein
MRKGAIIKGNLEDARADLSVVDILDEFKKLLLCERGGIHSARYFSAQKITMSVVEHSAVYVVYLFTFGRCSEAVPLGGPFGRRFEQCDILGAFESYGQADEYCKAYVASSPLLFKPLSVTSWEGVGGMWELRFDAAIWKPKIQ